MIEIYDISNGKLKYSAYTFWQLCDMVTEDFAYHTADHDNDIVWWIGEKARNLHNGGYKREVLRRLEQLLQFGEERGHRAFASRVSLLLGQMALDDGRHESAIRYSQKAVALLPDHIEALHQLARGFSAMGQYDKAAMTWRKANAIFPSEEAYLALAAVLGKLKRPHDQEKTLKSLLRKSPGSVKGMDMLTQFYRQRKRNKAAARLAQRIVDLHPAGEEHFGPFFEEFAEALIWAKYNYEARNVNKVLEFLDEEQERNPEESLSLLKAVMLYKLDKRLCREECCYELGKYFDGIGFDKGILKDDLRQVAEVFGEEFCRGVARFINNRLARHLLRRKRQKSFVSPDGTFSGPPSSPPPTSRGKSQKTRRRAPDPPAHLHSDVRDSN